MTEMARSYSLGLTGYPLEHSLSPRLHQAALSAMRLDGEYKLFPVPPFPAGEPEMIALLARLRSGELHGLNVTIPHKTAVLPFLDELSPAARLIGAVNTLSFRDGRLVGDNTDAPGFLHDLQRFAASAQPGFAVSQSDGDRLALVLGAGGAARAVVSALASSGWNVTIAFRRSDQAQARQLIDSLLPSFAHRSPPIRIESVLLDTSSLVNFDPTLLVNATPVGMWPDVNSNPWPSDLRFPSGMLVYDLVYKPPETALVRAARSAGLQAVNGLGMLVEQAALSLELWTGQPAPRSAMREAVAVKGPS